MIRRYQRVLLLLLIGASLLMIGYLVLLHRQETRAAQQTLEDRPMNAPSTGRAEQVELLLANDSTGTLDRVERSIALPETPTLRARAVLENLLAEYSASHSSHPLAGGAAVEDVFLYTPAPAGAGNVNGHSEDGSGGTVAVINLRGAWANAHPRGLTAETLTLQSILSTLHATLPDVASVRFLVDGERRATLNGTVALDRVYDLDDAVTVTEKR